MFVEFVNTIITVAIIIGAMGLCLGILGLRWKLFKSAASGYAALTSAILAVLFSVWWPRRLREGIGNLVLEDSLSDNEEEYIWN